MTTALLNTQASMEMEQLKQRLKATWMTGDYDRFSRFMERGTEVFFRNLGIQAGDRVLDVACGAGQLALIAARAGAVVKGCDIASNWVQAAQQRAARENLTLLFQEGDAEELPYLDGEFDAVVSMVGAMFAPRPELVAGELIRVCRPGGMIAMANWTPAGFIGQMFKVIAKHIAPSGMPSPVLWGDEAAVRQRLSSGVAEVRCTPRMFSFEYPFSPAEVVEFYRENYGPAARAFASLNGIGQDRLRSELTLLWSAHNTADEDRTKVNAEYLEVVAIRL
ncbi:MAG: class I SAM-dependent methyltransferase [Acidobacteria bacterium]|nr:class I SAM-dependent methyltransferase [Acidobacteriota bacterium]